ncbi:MAG: PTS sugar transporter subunit IIA [Acidobacteriota bacterium]
MNLSNLMEVRLVETNLSASSCSSCLRIMVDRMASEGLVKDPQEALRRLEEREKVMSTGIGEGIAVPHARCPEVDRTLIALGRCPAGIPWNAVDGHPVRIIFLILGRPESSAEHVRVLGSIARLVKKPGFHARLDSAGTAEEILAVIQDLEQAE